MSRSAKAKLSIIFILTITSIFFPCSTLMASNNIANLEHKKVMKEYIKEMRTLQNQIFSVVENVVSITPPDPDNLTTKVNFIYKRVENLDKTMVHYLDTVSRKSIERRDLLIAFDALHFLENSLYQFTEFMKETDPVKRIQLLGDFYYLRTSANDTLNRLENILSRE